MGGAENSSTGSSKFSVAEFPGMFQGIGKTSLQNLMGTNLKPNASRSGIIGMSGLQDLQQSNPFLDMLQKEMSNPYQTYGQGTPQNDMLRSVADQANSMSSQTRMGAPATTEELANKMSPYMLDFQNQRMQNLGQGAQLDLAQLLGISQEKRAYAENAMPQLIGGNNSRQDSSGFDAKLCCFIFIEAYNGLLPIVRQYRDEHLTERNRRGYYRIADKIVPLMQKSKILKQIVKTLMTDPMVSYGKYFYGAGKIGIIFKPVTKLWLGVFHILGFGKYIRKNGEEV